MNGAVACGGAARAGQDDFLDGELIANGTSDLATTETGMSLTLELAGASEYLSS
jgi:hypothetical protein